MSFIAIGLSAERHGSECEPPQANRAPRCRPDWFGVESLTWRIQPRKVQKIKLVVLAEMTCKRAGQGLASLKTRELNEMRRPHTLDVTRTTQNPGSHSVRLQVQAMKDSFKSALETITV